MRLPGMEERYIALFERLWGVASAVAPVLFGTRCDWQFFIPWLAIALVLVCEWQWEPWANRRVTTSTNP